MNTTWLLQLGIVISIFVSSSTQQAQNPSCQPIDATRGYEKTLFVFVVETSDILEYIKYAMKQFACTIPEADNIKSYILDYTKNESVTVKEEDFSTSKQFAGKIAGSLKNPSSIRDKCSRMNYVHESFSQQDATRKYANVKYIMFIDPCNLANLPQDWFLFHMVFLNNVVWYQQYSKHAVALEPSEPDAPQLLKDGCSKIIGTILGDEVSSKFTPKIDHFIFSHTRPLGITFEFCHFLISYPFS